MNHADAFPATCGANALCGAKYRGLPRVVYLSNRCDARMRRSVVRHRINVGGPMSDVQDQRPSNASGVTSRTAGSSVSTVLLENRCASGPRQSQLDAVDAAPR